MPWPYDSVWPAIMPRAEGRCKRSDGARGHRFSHPPVAYKGHVNVKGAPGVFTGG